MGLFSNLFSKKNTAAVQPQPVQMPEEKKPRYIIKNQRFILDNVKDHMEDIMDLVDENEDYKMKDRDFIDEKQENEKVYTYRPTRYHQYNHFCTSSGRKEPWYYLVCITRA